MSTPSADRALHTPNQLDSVSEARVHDVTAELFIAHRQTIPELYANNSFYALTWFVTEHAAELPAEVTAIPRDDILTVRCCPSELSSQIVALRGLERHKKIPLYITLLDRIDPAQAVPSAPVLELDSASTLRAEDFATHKAHGGVQSFQRLAERIAQDPVLSALIAVSEQPVGSHQSELILRGDLLGLLDALDDNPRKVQPRYVATLRQILAERMRSQTH